MLPTSKTTKEEIDKFLQHTQKNVGGGGNSYHGAGAPKSRKLTR